MAELPDSFHLLSDTRSFFLQKLAALLQSSGLLSDSAIQALQDGAAAYFDEVTSTSRRGTFAEEVEGLTSSRITLVGEDDVELGIRLDNMSARLFETTSGALWKTHLRFITLLRRPDLPKSANPVGPKGIAQGLQTMFAAAGATTIGKKLELLDHIEARLLEGLPTFYAEINDFLDRRGVRAAQATIIGSPEGPAGTDPGGMRENTLLALQQALHARLGSPYSPSTPASGGAAASLLNQANLERLVQRLDELDRQRAFDQTFAPTRTAKDMIAELFTPDGNFSHQPKVLKSAQLGIPNTAAESVSIDTLAMIFEVIFANPSLPDALKSVISSLQITLLKAAMKDSTLFSNEQHPARQVIDRMGLAVLGLPTDVAVRHPVCARLFEIAAELRGKGSADLADFGQACTRLDELLKSRNAAIDEAAKPYLPTITQLERRDAAGIQVNLALEKFIAANPPPVIRDFLQNSWRQLLRKTWLENGEQSGEWQENLGVIDDLLWTIQPKADPDERKTLARRLPDILKRLKAGMARISLPAETETAFLDACFELQTRALRTAPPPTPPNPVGDTDLFTDELAAAASQPVRSKLRVGTQVLTTLDFAEFRPAPSRLLPLKSGDWLQLHLAEDEVAVARLCRFNPGSLRVFLLNPDSGLALTVHPAILDRQLRNGDARIASASSLFETAASAALQQTAGD